MLSVVEHAAVPWRLLVVMPLWLVYLSQPAFGTQKVTVVVHPGVHLPDGKGSSSQENEQDSIPGTHATETGDSVRSSKSYGVLLAFLSHPFVVVYIGLKLFALGYAIYKLVMAVRSFVLLSQSSYFTVLTPQQYEARGRPECPILQDAADVPVELQCGHICDRDAIQQWVERRAECPMCRGKLTDPLENEPCAQGGLALPFMWL